MTGLECFGAKLSGFFALLAVNSYIPDSCLGSLSLVGVVPGACSLLVSLARQLRDSPTPMGGAFPQVAFRAQVKRDWEKTVSFGSAPSSRLPFVLLAGAGEGGGSLQAPPTRNQLFATARICPQEYRAKLPQGLFWDPALSGKTEQWPSLLTSH